MEMPHPAEDPSRRNAELHPEAREDESLSPRERKLKALRALERLAALRKGLPPVDAVEVIRSVRDDPEHHETV